MVSFFNPANKARLGTLGASLLAASGRLPQNVSRASLMGQGFQQAMLAGRQVEQDKMQKRLYEQQVAANEQKLQEAERVRMQRELGQELFGTAPGVTGGPLTTSLGTGGRAATLADIGRVYPERAAQAELERLTAAPKERIPQEVMDYTDPKNPIRRFVSRDQALQNPNFRPPGPRPSAPFSHRGTYYRKDGKLIHNAFFNNQTGKVQYFDEDNQLVDLPADARPRTPTSLDINVAPWAKFYELSQTMETERSGMRALMKYQEDVGFSDQGLGLIIDQLRGHLKTIFNGELTREELVTLGETGQLQRLLGKFRKEVVGGGVMTEIDAMRIVGALGGDIGALRNKKVAIFHLKNIFNEKLSNYNNVLVPAWNTQITIMDRGEGYKQIEKSEFKPFDVSAGLNPYKVGDIVQRGKDRYKYKGGDHLNKDSWTLLNK